MRRCRGHRSRRRAAIIARKPTSRPPRRVRARSGWRRLGMTIWARVRGAGLGRRRAPDLRPAAAGVGGNRRGRLPGSKGGLGGADAGSAGGGQPRRTSRAGGRAGAAAAGTGADQPAAATRGLGTASSRTRPSGPTWCPGDARVRSPARARAPAGCRRGGLPQAMAPLARRIRPRAARAASVAATSCPVLVLASHWRRGRADAVQSLAGAATRRRFPCGRRQPRRASWDGGRGALRHRSPFGRNRFSSRATRVNRPRRSAD